MIMRRPSEGRLDAISGRGGSFLRTLEGGPPPPDSRMLHPSAGSWSRPLGADGRTSDPRPRGAARRLRVLGPGGGARVCGARGGRLALILPDPPPEPSWRRGAARGHEPRLADAPWYR